MALFIFRPAQNLVELNTLYAQQLNFQLPDGSNLAMNAGSDIDYNNKEFNRKRVINLEGEAIFEVEKGESFTVSTDFGIVEVLGTSFNVFARDGQFEVSCKTGKVKVSTNDNSSFVILSPGQEALLLNGKIQKIDRVYEEDDWIKGIHHFDNASLKDVINEMERQFDVNIELDKDFWTKNYTGFFENKSIEGAFESVLWPLRLEFQKISDNNYILKSSEANQ